MRAEAFKEAARRHELREEWQQALQLYLQAVEARSDEEDPDIALHNRIGDLQVRIGDAEGAVTSYERAVDLYLDAGLPNNAIAVCRKIIRTSPRRPDTFLRMGRVRASQGLLVDARQNFLTYAEMMEARADTDEALRAIEEFVGLAPDEVETREFLADQLAALGREDESIRYLREAWQAASRNGDAERVEVLADRLRRASPDGVFDPADLADPFEGGAGGGADDLAAGPPDEEDHASPEMPGVFAGDEADEVGVEGGAEPTEDAGEGRPELEGFESTGLGTEPAPSELLRPEAGDPGEMASEVGEGDAGTEVGWGDAGGLEEMEGPEDTETDEPEGWTSLDPLPLERPWLSEEAGEDEASATPWSVEEPEGPAGQAAPGDDGEEEGAETLPLLDLGDDDPLMSDASPGQEGAFTEEDAGTEAASQDLPAEDLPAGDLPSAERPAGGDPERPAADYVDLGALVFDPPAEQTTRWNVEAEAPTADEDADFRKTLARFREKVAEHIGTEDAKAHYDLGMAYREMGLLDEAVGEFQQALRADPDNLAAIEVLGQCFLDRGEPKVAVHILERGLRMTGWVEDDFVGIFYFLGMAHAASGNVARAREFYERVFALDINFRDVTERLKALRAAPETPST